MCLIARKNVAPALDAKQSAASVINRKQAPDERSEATPQAGYDLADPGC